jgi:hypothetical protein
VNSCVNSPEDGPVGPKHVEIRRYMNKIETVTSVGFSFHMQVTILHNHTSSVRITTIPSKDYELHSLQQSHNKLLFKDLCDRQDE